MTDHYTPPKKKCIRPTLRISQKKKGCTIPDKAQTKTKIKTVKKKGCKIPDKVQTLAEKLLGATKKKAVTKKKTTRKQKKKKHVKHRVTGTSITTSPQSRRPTTSHVFTVATINLFNGDGNSMRHTLQQEIATCSPDLLVFQEAPSNLKLEGYRAIQWGGPGPYERMGAMIRLDSQWTETTHTMHTTQKCKTTRASVILSLHLKTNRDVVLRVGNVHLCGGRYDERVVHRCEDRSIDDCLRDMDGVKIESVQELILRGTDIILGDFNSDVHHYLKNKPHPSQEQYMKKSGWSSDQIRTWNISPFKLLHDKEYVLVEPQAQTSFYGTTTDVIWYKRNQMTLQSHGVIDMGANTATYPSEAASDHNGLVASFVIV